MLYTALCQTVVLLKWLIQLPILQVFKCLRGYAAIPASFSQAMSENLPLQHVAMSSAMSAIAKVDNKPNGGKLENLN